MLTSGASARIARAVELAKRVALKSDCATESAQLKRLQNRQRNAHAILVNGQRYAADEQPTQHKQFLSHRAIGEYLWSTTLWHLISLNAIGRIWSALTARQHEIFGV